LLKNYPDLKADANFRQFQDELAGTENRIAVSRMDYNAAVKEINATVRRFSDGNRGQVVWFFRKRLLRGG